MWNNLSKTFGWLVFGGQVKRYLLIPIPQILWWIKYHQRAWALDDSLSHASQSVIRLRLTPIPMGCSHPHSIFPWHYLSPGESVFKWDYAIFIPLICWAVAFVFKISCISFVLQETSEHKLSGLKQRSFVIFQVHGSELWDGSHGAKKPKVAAGLRALPEAPGETQFPCLLISTSRPHSSAYDLQPPPSKPAGASPGTWPPSSHLCLTVTLLAPSLPRRALGFTPVPPGWSWIISLFQSHFSRRLISSSTFILLCHVAWHSHSFQESGQGHPCWAHYSASTAELIEHISNHSIITR